MKTKTTTSLLLLYLFLISSNIFAKDITIADSSKTKNNHKLGLSLNLGTTPGIDLAYALSPKVTARLGFSYFKYNVNTTTNASDEDVKLAGDADLAMAGLSFEYHPFKKSSFKLFGGASYIDKGKVSVVVTPTGTYTFGSTSFTPDEIGNVKLSVDYGKSIAPFAGLGFGRTIPKSRIGFGFELGTYYTKTPEVIITGEKRLSSMSEQQAIVQENMKDWHYWPVINLRLAIRLD
ncbi:hypothetical protein VB264_19810 [Arcicella aquatica]|uniref:Outer membrane protein beta-barrel domain-containing protein n=1 Tax=Arcicella aquatica TaxID=217141 RepID=A0ABU5QTB0_9BACT|nr:hypothetical protein [Arcicella aquatica]MEA5260054.1 hypothetical protein [Arcicella aquatica]